MNRGDKCFSLATIQLQTRSPACLSQCRKTWWRNILHFSWAVRYVSRPCAKQGSDWGGRGRRARGLWPWYQPMAHCLRPVPGKWWGQTEGRGTPEWGCRSWWGIQSSLLLYCRPQSAKLLDNDRQEWSGSLSRIQYWSIQIRHTAEQTRACGFSEVFPELLLAFCLLPLQ